MPQHELNQILAFHTITLGKSNEEKSSIAATLGIDFAEYKRRIIGKEKECEFLLIMMALKVLKHLEAYDESLSHITQECTPDYSIEMRDDYKMMIEVKHVSNKIYSISKGNLKKRIDFARRKNVPLRFALSMCGYWGLFRAEYLKSNSGRIRPSDYIEHSLLDMEFATCSYMFTDGIISESIFSQQVANGLGIIFEPYGELISYKFFSGDKLIFEVKNKEDPSYIYIFLMAALQDRMANDYKDVKEKDDGSTLIIEKLNGTHIIPEFELVLSIIKQLSPVKGTNSEDNIFAIVEKSSKSENKKLPYITLYRSFMFFLAEQGVKITCLRGKYGYPFEEYAKQYWTESIS